MANVAAAKKEKKSYLRIPYEFLEEGFEKLSRTVLFLKSNVFSFSFNKKDPNAQCYSKMSDFSEKLHITERHASRSMKRCIENGYIERVTDDEGKVIRSWYKYAGSTEFGKGYIRVDMELLYKQFRFGADDTHVAPYEDYLSLSEILVLSYMITLADNIKSKTAGTFKGSYRSIAKKLRMSPSTVRAAVLRLMKARLISRMEEDKAVNGSGWTVYRVDKSLLIRTQEQELKAEEKAFNSQLKESQEKKIAQEPSSKPEWQRRIEAIDAKSDRERHYAQRREKAQARADYFLKKANQSERFKEITSELGKMELALAKAEVYDRDKLPDLERRKARILKERKLLLSRLGINELDLSPIYQCSKCSDTGFMKNGAGCDCYLRIAASATVGVGKLDK